MNPPQMPCVHAIGPSVLTQASSLAHALLFLFLASIAAGAAPTDSLSIDLGPTNVSHGLSVPSGGDGANIGLTLAGSHCRRVSGAIARYMYIKADESLVPIGCYDAYLAFEYLDDHMEIVRAEYDKADPTHDKRSFYTPAEDVVLVTNGGGWRRGIIHLPDARFGHAQNGQADMRLVARSLAVRKIEISFAKPADYVAGGIDPAKLEHLRTHLNTNMELDIGDDPSPAEAALFKAVGINCAESYVTWQTVEDAGEGKWDWSRWDKQVDILQKAGLQWAPLLVIGPAYGNPKWYRESDKSFGYVCLEHGEKTKIESLWNPEFRPWVDRFLKAFADRYRDRGVLKMVRLGLTGVYGETLYPSSVRPDDWIFHIPGKFHTHHGWWAGDRYAVADFRRAMQRRYREIAKLNGAWRVSYASFSDVAPFLPEKAPSLRARVDFVEWYMQAMTDYSAFGLAETRKYLPDVPIYLSVGGAGEPILGADFTALSKACVPYHARMRITNEGSDYAHNFSVTREASTSARAFGVDIGYEPASGVTPDGIVSRIYNAAASGAVHLFDYMPNMLQDGICFERFSRFAPLLGRRHPLVYAGLYLPKASWDIEPRVQGSSLRTAAELRRFVDAELLDRTTMSTPLGQNVKVLLIADAPYAEASEIETLKSWVSAGGILVVQTQPNHLLLRTPEGSDEPAHSLVNPPPTEHPLVRPTVTAPPRHFRMTVGPGDGVYFTGNWHGAEHSNMLTREKSDVRWSSDKSGLMLPCDPSTDNTLVLSALLSTRSLPGTNRVLVNGTVVGEFTRAGPQTYRFEVAKKVLAGRTVAEVTLDIHTFLPTDFGDQDTRRLGIVIGSAEMIAAGADNEPAVTVPLSWQIDWSHAGPYIHRLGAGAVLCIPTDSDDALGQAVADVLTQPQRLIPGARSVNIPLPGDDGVFATETSDGFLYFNSTDQAHTVAGVEVPAHGIVEQKTVR